MKTVIITRIQWSLLLICLLPGCTKRFDSLNSDPTTISAVTPATAGNAFALAQYNGIYGDAGIYQLARNLFVDYYSQYFAIADQSTRSDRNVIVQDWIISQWATVYSGTWPTLKVVMDITEKTDPAAHAITKIWKVYVFHSNTDFYGPIPYFQAGKGTTSIPYDSQQDIYHDFFKLLDEAVAALKQADRSKHPFGTNDLIFHGDIDKWIKLANTLRLRLALRISGPELQRAKEEAEKAVAAGVMTATADDAMMDVGPNSNNGLNVISSWNYFRMSASMESYLKGFEDPRMPVYFRPAAISGEYHGIRNGLTAAQIGDPKNNVRALSDVGPRFDPSKAATTRIMVMYAAEAYFLRAEGALNGWNMGGTAQELYEKGIATSMDQWGVTDAAVIKLYQQGTTTPVKLNDYLSSPAVADIPVKFSAMPEKQRQQILTQKWIALYPDGIEAWAEIRRTGYPLLYPVVNSDNPDVPKGQIIRRFPFLDYEKQTNTRAVQEAQPLLGGPDKPTTPVWWNK